MLLGRVCKLLGSKLLKSTDNTEPCISWLNDIIYITILSCIVRVCKCISVLFLFLCCKSCRIRCCFKLFSVKNLNSSRCTHNCNLCCWPSVVDISSKVFRAHNAVCSAVCFSKNNCNFWNSSLAVSVKKFCTVKDNSAVLLLCARKEARYIYQCYLQRGSFT